MNKPEQVNVKNLFSAKEETCFRIPDYQREYCWDEERCRPLWEDLINPRKEIFLGTFVTNIVKEEDGQTFLDVVDGQQRVTTFYLILRAGLQYLSEQIGECEDFSKGIIDKEIWDEMRGNVRAALWMKNELGQRDRRHPRLIINSPFSEAKTDFTEIVTSFYDKNSNVFETLGENIKKKSRYLQNLYFFYIKFKEVGFMVAFKAMNTILDNFQVLHINCESEEEALIVFDTLNNRGVQLKDADIFKSHLYKAFETSDEKSDFIKSWNEILNKLKDINGGRLVIDDLFHQYTFFVRLKNNIIGGKDIKAVRNFYLDKNLENGRFLEHNKESIVNDLSTLASMWYSLEKREDFSSEVLKWYHCLSKGKNDPWMWAVAVFFLRLAPNDNGLNDVQMNLFAEFLKRLTAGLYYSCLVTEGAGSDNAKSFIFRILSNLRVPSSRVF